MINITRSISSKYRDRPYLFYANIVKVKTRIFFKVLCIMVKEREVDE